ncbi:endolytic transglycosylase MltG [Adlercreutzia sp. ZJ473]|uniref:endolytic transglycosylase MltG n=1 Tax=Adlercreutzia sp. ZJ473 TaxID=2722822 RepID=UPI0015574E62
MSHRRRQVTYSSHPNHAARAAHARGSREFRTYDTSYIRPKQSKAPMVVALALALLVVIVGALFLMRSCAGPELLAEGEQAQVVVEQGESARDVGNSLAEARLVASSQEFVDAVSRQNADASIIPGTYTFSGGVTVDEILRTLQAGPAFAGALSVPEGLRLSEIAARVQEVTGGRVTAEAFTQAASDASAYAADYAFLEGAGENSLEGFLFPKTYDVPADATAESVVRMMLDQFAAETASLDWSYPESQGLSLYDALKLASIVEKESTGDEGIRARVAAVFYNRLTTEGDPSYGLLQSDATTAYEVGHDPTPEEVHADTPYSTYAHAGLPPTPICSPGLACLQAVCAPDADALGRDYFFYFDAEGNYSFSATYDEHMSSFS